MTVNQNQTVGEIVAQDYRAASVFRTHGIDFCCRGGRTIQDVCESKNIAVDTLLEELEEAMSSKGGEMADYSTWPLDLLVDYIEKRHHRYVVEKTPELLHYLDKLCKVHGERHPELFQIRDEFVQSAGELAAHMKKEELILFPYVRRLASEKEPPAPPFGSVQNPINMMMHEHTVEGDRFERISRLSNNYTPPADGCTTYRVAFAMLQEFEDDLHMHIHLENNILFPRAIEMEKNAVA